MHYAIGVLESACDPKLAILSKKERYKITTFEYKCSTNLT